MSSYLCTPGPGFRLQALLCLIMVGWAGVARGVSERLFVTVTVGPRLYLSAADRQIGSITMQHGGAVCLGWLWHPPLGGILMSSPGTSIRHLTSWGEQGHPNTHMPVLSRTLSGHTYLNTQNKHMNSRKWQQVPKVLLSSVQPVYNYGVRNINGVKVCMLGIAKTQLAHISL